MVKPATSIITRIRKERHPLRFLVSRALLRSGIDLPFTLYFSRAHNVCTYLHASSAAQKLLAGKYRPEVDVAVFERFVKPGHCVFDVGANIGMFTTLAARLAGETGRVYAFEPTRDSFHYLLENVFLNKVDNVLPVFGAVSDTAGEVRLHDHQYSKEQNYIDPTATTGSLVPAYRLDEYLALIEQPVINFLKIDVEGAELLALRSLGERIKDVEVLYLEFVKENYEAFDYGPEDLFAFLTDNQFKLYRVTLEAGELVCTQLESAADGAGQNIIATRTSIV